MILGNLNYVFWLFFTDFNFLKIWDTWPYHVCKIWKMLVHYFFNFCQLPFGTLKIPLLECLELSSSSLRLKYTFVAVILFSLSASVCTISITVSVFQSTDLFSMVFNHQKKFINAYNVFGVLDIPFCSFLIFCISYVPIYINWMIWIFPFSSALAPKLKVMGHFGEVLGNFYYTFITVKSDPSSQTEHLF